MTTPENEWREDWEKDFRKQFAIKAAPNNAEDNLKALLLEKYWQHGIITDMVDFIQKLLDQHSAHLVERLQDMAIVDDYGEERKTGFQIAKDLAIDIVKTTT